MSGQFNREIEINDITEFIFSLLWSSVDIDLSAKLYNHLKRQFL